VSAPTVVPSSWPVPGGPGYWALMCQLSAEYAWLQTSEGGGTAGAEFVQAVVSAYGPNYVLDVAALLLLDVSKQCRRSLRTSQGQPDLSRLVPGHPVPVATITTVGGPVDGGGTEQEGVARARPVVQEALEAVSAGGAGYPVMLTTIWSVQHDIMTTFGVLSLARAALLAAGQGVDQQ